MEGDLDSLMESSLFKDDSDEEDGSFVDTVNNSHSDSEAASKVTMSTFDDTNLLSRFRALEETVEVLKARTSGDGVRFRGVNFQSPDELKVWIKTHLKSYKFGIFLDGVSI